MAGKITPAQKHLLRDLLRDLLRREDYDLRTVTYMHRRLGVAESWIGKPADQWLDSLLAAEASRLIAKLQGERDAG